MRQVALTVGVSWRSKELCVILSPVGFGQLESLVGITALIGRVRSRAFLEIAADRHRGCRRAGTVGLLKAVISAVETPIMRGWVAGRGFGVESRLISLRHFGPSLVSAYAPI